MMINPQLENGYTPIANELMEVFVRTELGGQEFRLMLFIIRKTYGFRKKEDYISLSQMAKALKTSVVRCSQIINSLQQKNIITLKENCKGKTKKYMFNKNYEQWRPLRKTVSLKKNEETLKEKRKRPLRKTVSTKETLTKETIQKEPSALQTVIDYYFSITDNNKNKEWVKLNYPRHCPAAKRLLLLASPEEVKKIITKGKAYFENKNLDWKLETIEKHWNEIKRYKIQGEEWYD